MLVDGELESLLEIVHTLNPLAQVFFLFQIETSLVLQSAALFLLHMLSFCKESQQEWQQ